jgi:putative MATE family efflux protein
MAVSMTYNIGAGILRAMGNSRTPFYFLIAASTANVLLDLLFVGVFRWHAAGAAFATVLSQLLSAILVITALLKTDLPCRMVWKKIHFHKPTVKKIFSLGLPVGAQSSLYPISNMMIQSNINSFGINAIAAWAVCGKLDFLIWLIVGSFGSAASTFVAQNFGARLYGRARNGTLLCVGMSLVCICSISAVLYFFCGPLGRLFISDNEVIQLSIHLMRFLAPLYFIYIGGEILSGAIRGMGETFRPMILTLLGTCVCRVAWVLFAVPLQPTLKMVIWSYPVSWIVTSLSFIIFYLSYKSRKLPLQ